MNIPGFQKDSISFTFLDYAPIRELKYEGLSDESVKVISEIINAYPFTFLEKESLRKKVDKLNGFFWIVNRKGYCELVNQRLSEYFDTSFAQLEGNNEEIFFPNEFHLIIKTSTEAILLTKKFIRLEGIEFVDNGKDVKFDLIKIPIINQENTVIGLICISVTSKSEKKNGIEKKYLLVKNLIAQIQSPAAIISANNRIAAFNGAFQQMLASLRSELENSLINKVFSDNFVMKFNEFLASEKSEITLESSDFLFKNSISLQFNLGKIFEEKGSVIGTVLIIKNQPVENLAERNKNNFIMIENLIRNNPEAVLVCDKENLKFLEVNDAAVKLYGYRRDEFLQMDLTDLYCAEDIQLLSESSKANIKEGLAHGPFKHKKKDGQIILVEISRYTVKYHDHEAHYNIIRNVSDRQEQEKKNQAYKAVFENSEDLIFVTDSAGFIKYVNQSVTNILGYTKSELVNSSLTSLVTDEDRSNISQKVFRSQNKETSVIHVNIKSADGRIVSTEIIFSPILDFNKEIDSFTIIGRVKQSHFQSEIEISGEKLKGEVAAEQMDAKFLSDFFHELLTPINVILGFSQDLLEDRDQSEVNRDEAAKIIKQNRVKLLQSMNAALEYTSLKEKGVSVLISETRITDIIEAVEKDINELKSLDAVEFAYGKISSSLKFETDKQKFKSFLFQLFRLAAKISHQKKIHFSAYAQEKDSFVVTFRDQITHSSKQLVDTLNSIFSQDNLILEQYDFPKTNILLTRALLKVLRGKFVILSEEKDKNDYAFVFPISYPLSKTLQEEDKKVEENEEEKLRKKEIERSKIESELRAELLKQKIRKREAEKKKKIVDEEDQEVVEWKKKAEAQKDKIEYYDFDLEESLEESSEEEFEIVETTPRKEIPAPPPKVKSVDEKIDISNFSCLYIEDQIDSQVLFSIQMKGLKNLNFAISFEETLPLIESTTYDFIVIDINLHGSYNGLDMLRILRNMPRFENTPIFAVTAYLLPGDEQKFIRAGFNGFISKPVFRDQVIDLLAEVFKEPQKS